MNSPNPFYWNCISVPIQVSLFVVMRMIMLIRTVLIVSFISFVNQTEQNVSLLGHINIPLELLLSGRPEDRWKRIKSPSGERGKDKSTTTTATSSTNNNHSIISEHSLVKVLSGKAH